MSGDMAAENTDRELWREREGDHYADSLFVTKGGGIGINCGGSVIVKALRVWHETVAERDRLHAEVEQQGKREVAAYLEQNVKAAELKDLSFQLTAEIKGRQELCREVLALRAEKAELVAALRAITEAADVHVELADHVERARAALAKATATEGGNDDGTDPTTTELLKPRGNGGVVSPDICFDALLLVGVDTQGPPDSWTQEELDRAYDWAMRVYLKASDYVAVSVPPRPHYIPRATEGGQ